MYIGEVFCLLGHNGAGKTTTISMLSGLIDITSGDALILGKNIKTQENEARRSMGVCPQKVGYVSIYCVLCFVWCVFYFFIAWMLCCCFVFVFLFRIFYSHCLQLKNIYECMQN